MYACICHAVSERTVEVAVLAGADTIEALGDATGAGTGCGCCHDELQEVIDRAGRPLLRLYAS